MKIIRNKSDDFIAMFDPQIDKEILVDKWEILMTNIFLADGVYI